MCKCICLYIERIIFWRGGSPICSIHFDSFLMQAIRRIYGDLTVMKWNLLSKLPADVSLMPQNPATFDSNDRPLPLP